MEKAYAVAGLCYVVILCTVTRLSCCNGMPLTDRILHYDTLTYDVNSVRTSHDKIRRSTEAHLSSSRREIIIHFHALDRNFTMRLQPSREPFSPNAKFLVHTSKGVVSSSYDPLTFYKGRIIGDQLSKVHGHIKDGVFDGEVITGDHKKYHIETADKYFNEKTDFHSVIYSFDDVLIEMEGKVSGCATKKKLLSELEKLQASAKPMKRKLDPAANSLSWHLREKKDIRKRIGDRRYCPVFIAADHLFVSSIGGGSEDAAISEIASIFSSVQEVFFSSDFDEDGQPDRVAPILVKTELLTSSSYGGLFADSDIGVSDFLDKWSTIDHESFCLALLLTYRDFANGVLGLAWVAQPPGGSRGGVCEDRTSLSIGERSLNTAIVTYLNYGSRQPRGVVSITIAHEFGHNFGSSHDPEGSDLCSPGGSDGNYIMYPRATDGNRRNNDVFSPCSNAAIRQILETKTDCFTDNAAFCGNQITEENEECDCGSEDPEVCASNDPCCEPGSCVLVQDAACSGEDKCCNRETCQFMSQNTECSIETECGERAVCSGDSAECPEQTNKNIPCNNATQFCQNAECSGSVCLVFNSTAEDCQCTDEEEQCHVCCMTDGVCVSTFTLASEGKLSAGQFRASGRSCDNYRGYCSDDSVPICIGVDNEQVLNDLLDLFSLETLDSVIRWLKTYWWVPIIVVVVIIIIVLLLHFTYRKRKPIKKAARRASLSVRRASTTGAADTNSAAKAREKVNKERREKLQRLKKFFPSCDNETIIAVLRTCRTEEQTVRQLITLGFPMKKVPFPRL